MKYLTVLQYTIALLGIAILSIVGLFVFPPSIPCLLPFFLFLTMCGWVIGHTLFPNETPYKTLLGALVAISFFPLTITPLYWFFGYAAWYPLVPIALLAFGAGILVRCHTIPLPNLRLPLSHITTAHAPYALAILVPLLLLAVLMQKMTGDTLFSPWQLIGPKFWILSGIALPLLLWSIMKCTSTTYRYIILSLWYLLIYSMILFTHKYAFGFDQHIHLASMEWILDRGLLEPKVPYYLGQYFLAIPFAEITRLSLDWVSRAIVPIGAAFLLPLFLLQKKNITPTILVFLPLLPLGFLTFTTPNNLALLLALSTILAAWVQREQPHRGWNILICFLTLWTLLTHALIGIPLVCTLLLLKSNTTLQRILAWIALIVSVPLLLALYGGGTTLAFEPHIFFDLFKQPHWYIGTTDSLLLHSIYAYKQILLPLMLLIAGFGAWHMRQDRTVRGIALAIVGIVLASALIATSIRFPALISYEQTAYAARLLSLALVLIIPLFLLGLSMIFERIRTTKILPLFIILIIPLFLVSWYFTYPTRDKISYYTGASIRDADIEAIHFIEEHAAGEPYIVLTNQTVSAAALSIYGFERYRTVPSGSQEYLYAIPTGGPLYQYFRAYVYDGYDRSALEEAMTFAGVDRAYFIHTNYWAPAAEIRDVSKEVADEWWEFGGGRVWVYVFKNN